LDNNRNIISLPFFGGDNAFNQEYVFNIILKVKAIEKVNMK